MQILQHFFCDSYINPWSTSPPVYARLLSSKIMSKSGPVRNPRPRPAYNQPYPALPVQQQQQQQQPLPGPPPMEHQTQGTSGDGFPAAIQYRQCRRCNQNFEWDGEEYKTHCTPCFGDVVRSCRQCGKNIPLASPKWVHQCLDCYKAKKALNFGTCPTCPPDVAHHLRRKLDEPCCTRCKQQGKLFFLQGGGGRPTASPLSPPMPA